MSVFQKHQDPQDPSLASLVHCEKYNFGNHFMVNFEYFSLADFGLTWNLIEPSVVMGRYLESS